MTTMPPLSIMLALCPICQHGNRCPGVIVAPAANGGVTCAKFAPKVRKRDAMPAAHILALPDREPCADCACRKGSTPNETHHSRVLFEACVSNLEPFLCHDGGADRVCAGWLRAAKARIRSMQPGREIVGVEGRKP